MKKKNKKMNALKAVKAIRKLRKGVKLGKKLDLKQLIEEGRNKSRIG